MFLVRGLSSLTIQDTHTWFKFERDKYDIDALEYATGITEDLLAMALRQ